MGAAKDNKEPKNDHQELNQTQGKTESDSSSRGSGFIRDRIAKRKEEKKKEVNEDIDEDADAAKPVDELAELVADDVTDFSLYRESYVLTVTENVTPNPQASKANDSFDVTQMSNGQFESFFEVSAIFNYFSSDISFHNNNILLL